MIRIKQIIPLLILFESFPLLSLSSQPLPKEIAMMFQRDIKNSQYDFSAIDNYVSGLKTTKNMTETELVSAITKQSQSNIEKARAIFIWIANNIAYDTSSKITSKEDALKQGKGVCQAYSGIFQSFGELAGLEVVTISGDSKQYYYKQPSDLDRGGHAWNAVKMDDGRWLIVDATWGAGHVNNRTFTRQLSDHWFDAKPEIFIFTHFPKDDQWQLLNKPISRDAFLRLPPLSPRLVSWGFNPVATFNYFIKAKDASFPEIFSIDIDLQFNMMPVSNKLKKGKSYRFEVVLPENEDIALIINNKDWMKFEKDGNNYSVTFTPESKGDALLAVKQHDGKFGGVFKYEIVN